ncbi:uncharacterized protein RHIMIDRAFT_278216 [Rhizopus microsporus ATCC 52813]|uniref:Uncharacterized protein n=1 Tax=Rhizopus microsporus ATCC 52813 TaxID=1340429 RepID=A0A2G4T0B5_RHIZD|nr:uncharacterized protein RHIMIDRAFT_278216 [Rhizopus microsporus ATCC 52813]PHZ14116.1 hypothetical protein RHIMIDRAFT_278216 [Rhizopus microsporus ATCC 52813]
MHENCKAENDGNLYCYTSNQRTKETKSRKFRKLQQDTKPELVKQWETHLFKYPASTVDVTKFQST